MYLLSFTVSLLLRCIHKLPCYSQPMRKKITVKHVRATAVNRVQGIRLFQECVENDLVGWLIICGLSEEQCQNYLCHWKGINCYMKRYVQRASSFVVFMCHIRWFIAWIIYARNTIININTQRLSPIYFFSLREACLWHMLKTNCTFILLCDSPLPLEKLTLSCIMPYIPVMPKCTFALL